MHNPHTNDLYLSQRQELFLLLERLAGTHEPLEIHGQILLYPDDVYRLIEKIKNSVHFSRKERHALTEAGFSVEQLYPHL